MVKGYTREHVSDKIMMAAGRGNIVVEPAFTCTSEDRVE